MSEAVTSPPGESTSRTTARTFSSFRACSSSQRKSSTIDSPTLPAIPLLIRPRSEMTAILFSLPRVPALQNHLGEARAVFHFGFDHLQIAEKRSRRERDSASTLAQSATNKKMLRQPSFRFAAMPGMKSPKKCGGTSAFREENGASAGLAGKLLFNDGNYDTVASKRTPREERGGCASSPQEPREDPKTPSQEQFEGRR